MSTPESHPAAYVGWHHETRGSDLIAAFAVVNELDPGIAAHWMPLVRTLDATQWYPIDLLLALGMAARERFGEALLRRMGERIFEVSHAPSFRASTVADVAFGIDGLYRAANRGDDIGGWGVVTFTDTHALIEKTTPHACLVEEGILIAACRAVGEPVELRQRTCVQQGAAACLFELTPLNPQPRVWGTAP
jgi:hypothetical protein